MKDKERKGALPEEAASLADEALETVAGGRNDPDPEVKRRKLEEGKTPTDTGLGYDPARAAGFPQPR